jgi:drug/metabolite transporter (DMT)-like permease
MRNWRTTLIGAVLAGVTFLAQFQQNGGNLDDWKLWVIPALVTVLGYVAKDAGVTGSVKALGLLLCLGAMLLSSCGTILTRDQAIRDGINVAAGALDGYVTAGRQGAVAGATAAELANLKRLARTSAKQPVGKVQPGGKG